jgi:cell division protein FtsB
MVWMLFFDQNDVFTQMEMRGRLADLEEEKEYYIDKIKQVNEDRRELLEQPGLLEKFAREKYLMKKTNEQLFIVIDSETPEVLEEEAQ